jgi:hypothetical protein
MVSITLSVPEELKREMDSHPELNWSEIARRSIREKLELLNRMDAMLAKSKLTEKDALEIGRMVNKGVAKRWKDEMNR